MSLFYGKHGSAAKSGSKSRHATPGAGATQSALYPCPKKICIDNCDPEHPFYVHLAGGEACIRNCDDDRFQVDSTIQNASGTSLRVGVENYNNEPLDTNATVSGCLAVKNCDDDVFQVSGDVNASVHGSLSVAPSDPSGFLVRGDIKLDPQSCVQVANKAGDRFDVDAKVSGSVSAHVCGDVSVHNSEEDPLHVAGHVCTTITRDSCLKVEPKDDDGFLVQGGITLLPDSSVSIQNVSGVPFEVTGTLSADIAGKLGVYNYNDQPFTVDGEIATTILEGSCLQVVPKDSEGFEIQGEITLAEGSCVSVNNKDGNPFLVAGAVNAHVCGEIAVSNANDAPFCVAGHVCTTITHDSCLKVEPKDDDGFLVQGGITLLPDSTVSIQNVVGAPFEVTGTLSTDVEGSLGVYNYNNQPLTATLTEDSCLQVEPKDDDGFLVQGALTLLPDSTITIINDKHSPLFVAGCVNAHVCGEIAVSNADDAPFCVAGHVCTTITSDSCLKVAPKDDDGFLVQGALTLLPDSTITIVNDKQSPLFVSGCVNAHVCGEIAVSNADDAPFCVAGHVCTTITPESCLKVEPKDEEGFLVQGGITLLPDSTVSIQNVVGAPFEVTGTLSTDVEGSLGVYNYNNQPLKATLTEDSCLQVEPKDDDGFLIQGALTLLPDSTITIVNDEDSPLFVAGCVNAHVCGVIGVSNADAPFCIAGEVCTTITPESCLKVEPKDEDGFLVQGGITLLPDSTVSIQNVVGAPFEVTGTLSTDVEGSLGVYNYNNQPLKATLTEDSCLQVEPKDDKGFLVQGALTLLPDSTITITNDPNDPFTIDGTIDSHVCGSLLVYTDCDEPLCVEASGCVEVFNCPDKPLFIDNGKCPFAVEGCLGIENAGTESFCVALENKLNKPLLVDGSQRISWDDKSRCPVPVIGQLEIGNCCGEPLKMEVVGLTDLLLKLAGIFERLIPPPQPTPIP